MPVLLNGFAARGAIGEFHHLSVHYPSRYIPGRLPITTPAPASFYTLTCGIYELTYCFCQLTGRFDLQAASAILRVNISHLTYCFSQLTSCVFLLHTVSVILQAVFAFLHTTSVILHLTAGYIQ